MGITQLINNYYEQVTPYQSGKPHNMTPGQIAWVPTLFIDPNINIINSDRVSRGDHNNAKLKFNRLNSDHFTSKNEEQLPIPNIKLNAHEELMAFKAKKRPCIFVGKADQILTPEEIKTIAGGKKHFFTNDFLFIPMYSTHKEDNQKGYTAEFVKRIKFYQYTHLFYLPECNLKGLETYYPPKEGIARLDRLFITSPVVPNVSPTDLRLTEEVYKHLMMHVREYILKETDGNLSELRELLDSALNDEGQEET